ncbi:MAG TPA: N,N-dimethylformamidase beta subunit family domain-containing protein [Mycobacteriales bacterium]|nr:N,N-dimethylformamidase beta subunit family domain-containing protein [Mycobacteriales bacterium]
MSVAVHPLRRTVPEYDQPGDSHWRVTRPGPLLAVNGYLDRTTVMPGDAVQLFAASTNAAIRADVFRMGWYAGKLARRVAGFERVIVPRPSEPALDPATRTITAGWSPVLRFGTGGWTPGAYLIRLRCDDGERHVPFILTSPRTLGAPVVVHSTATWQAYNTWGGYSLYQGPGGPADYDNRAYVVSFARPFDGNGAQRFLDSELGVVALIERLRLPVAHTTSEQLDLDPQRLDGATAVISLGHDEYWTPTMRERVTTARDRGVNVAFLGANACFRRIRLERSRPTGDRDVVCYKTDYQLDPDYGVDNAAVTNDYREPPDPDPECTLTGTYYEAYPTSASYTVYSPDSWLFGDVKVETGEEFPGLIGPEYDRVNPVVPLPRPMQVLSHSRLTCKGIHSFSDSAYYTRPSGAGVFNAGTMSWVHGLAGSQGQLSRRTTRLVTAVTSRLLTEFAKGPALERGLEAHDNLDAVHPWVGDPTYLRHNLW